MSPLPTELLHHYRGLQITLDNSVFAGKVNLNESYLKRLFSALYEIIFLDIPIWKQKQKNPEQPNKRPKKPQNQKAKKG